MGERRGEHKGGRVAIDPVSVAMAREQLRAMARGMPIAEAAVEGFSDWQVIEALERIWTVGTAQMEKDTESGQGPSLLQDPLDEL